MATTKSGKKIPKAANGSNSIYKSKDGSKYIGQIVIGKTEKGTYRYKRFTAPTKSEVSRKIQEYQQGFVVVKDATDIYLGTYLKDYVEKVKRIKLKPASYDREYRVYEVINRYIGKYQLGELTSELVSVELVDKMYQDKYSYSSIHKAIMLLSQCIKYAVNMGKLAKNKCTNITRPSKKLFKTKEIRWLNDGEIFQFIKQALTLYANGKPRYRYGLAIVTIIYTGMRGGELCALKWKDIDFQKNIIHINGNTSIVYEYKNDEKIRTQIEQDSTKTSTGRVIPMNKQSKHYFELLKAQYSSISLDDYIVNNTNEIITVERLSQTYSDIAKACEIENPQGIHTLRHTCASLMIRKGVDIKIISEILGHKDVAFTYNVYVHILEEQKASAIGLLDLE